VVRLGGWKRIGIIASAVWSLGAGAYIYNHVMDYWLTVQRVQCMEECPGKGNVAECYAACQKPNAEYLSLDRRAALKTSGLLVFISVPLGACRRYGF
jgi:hypothetical protein